MKLFTSYLDENLHEKLKEIANKKGMKIKCLIEEAIKDLIKKYES